MPRLARPGEAEALRDLVRAAYAHYVPRLGREPFPIPDDYAARIRAGQAWVDWLFMVGLLGIGVSLLLGVGMRIATASGALMYALMYAAVLPLENNPVVDDHLVGVIAMAVLGLSAAGSTWGLGRWWKRTGIVQKFPVLR